jgi:1,4-dihydroxy-2-naphthoyl-CoA hydrolase
MAPEEEENWASAMGIEIVSTTADEVVAEVDIQAKHLQGFGLIHGGVHAGLVEMTASRGAWLYAKARGQAPPVGLENHTTFIKAAGKGRIRATATPITRGKTTQVWEVSVRDEAGALLATGRVRLLCREATTAATPASNQG